MLRTDRLCIYVIIFGLLMMIPGIQFITFADELCAMLFGLIAVTDCIVNNNWRRYRLLWIIMMAIIFYAIYSLTYVHENVPVAILTDSIIEIKPFVPFAVLLAIGPTLTEFDKKIFKHVCIANSSILSIALICGTRVVNAIVFHPTYAGTIIFTSMMFYLYCSIDSKGNISSQAKYITTLFLSLGLLCMKSKYYGIYVLCLYFIFIYKPGMMRHFSTKHAIIILTVIGIIIAVSWNKINYYFISGNSNSFDPTTAQSFARPVLYLTGFTILFDYFPFGTGLASFASSASADWYSNVYYEYGINNVHGLSPNADFNFICDAFYPSLAQFGVFGIVLFVWFWMYSYNYFRHLIRLDSQRFKYILTIGSLIICFILIESIAATTFTHVVGMTNMCLLGVCCAYARKEIKHSDDKQSLTIPTYSLKKI